MGLIVTCPRHFEEDASREIEKILNAMDDPSPAVRKSNFPGIVVVESVTEPVSVSRRVAEMVRDEPWEVRYLQRVIPVQRWVRTDLDEIVTGLGELAAMAIRDGRRYRVTVEKRGSSIPSREIISKTADLVDNDVSLESPDIVLLAEIVGETTGLSAIRESDITSVEKEKRRISE